MHSMRVELAPSALERAGCARLCQQRGHATDGRQQASGPGFAPFCSPSRDEYSGAGETFPPMALGALSRVFPKSPLSGRLSELHRLSAAARPVHCVSPRLAGRRGGRQPSPSCSRARVSPGLGALAVRSWPHSGISR